MDGDPPSEVETGEAVRTFLFADVRGYTRFIVEHGDAAGVRLLERFESVARRAISSRHGQVIGWAGDEAVAVFTSAREALRAAVALQADLSSTPEEDPSMPLQVGIGIDTGEAVSTGTNYVGAALNLAARLCKLAGPQEVLVSDGVVHVARKLDGIDYEERGFAQLKGFRDPVRVFRVLDANRLRGPGGGTVLRGGEAGPSAAPLPIGGFLGALPASELVARSTELGRALAAADATAAGSGRLVVLSGEPGVGKTRLAQEVMLTLRNRRFLVAAGRCYQIHQSVPFYPFLDALTSVYAQSSPEVRAAVSTRWPYLSRLLPELRSTAPPATSSGPEEQQLLFREITGFLQAISAELPVGILLDDLHWADGASLELLQHLAQHTRGHRVLFVATYRDVEVGRHHPLEAALRDLLREDLVERIPIRRFEPEGTSQFVAATLGDSHVSPELATVIHQRADGNPFFTQQLVRYLVERGDVYRKEGRWTERSHRRLEVPESVRSVIGQRMERLQEGTQEVLREAAVLGQTFSFDALEHLTGRTDDAIESAVEEARSSGLLEERQPDHYAFDHALTQQTLYGELPARKRRKLHLTAAEAIERLPEDRRAPLSAELAWHFLEAAQEERAIPYALAAGDRARSVFAQREAERQYSTVLEIAEHTGNREGEVEALSRRARLRRESFQGKAALPDYERLLEIARRRGDEHLELAARLGIADASYIVALDETDRDMPSQSREMYESAYALADRLGDPKAKVEALLGTRWLADFSPEYAARARANVREALAISRGIGDEELLLRSELAAWGEGSRKEAEETGARLVRRLEERHDLHRLNSLYFTMMWANLDWAEFERAVEVCREGARVAEQIGVPPVQYGTLEAFALLQLGRYGDAWSALQREVTDADHPFGQAMHALGLGMYYFDLKAFGRAADASRDLLERAARLRRAWMRARGLALLARSRMAEGTFGSTDWRSIQEQYRDAAQVVPAELTAEVLLWEGHAEAALDEVRKAMGQARSEESTLGQLRAQELEARVLVGLGRAQESVELLETARGVAEKSKALPLLARLLALKARALTLLHDATGASDALAEARSMVQRLAASIPDPDLRRGYLSDREVESIFAESR